MFDMEEEIMNELGREFITSFETLRTILYDKYKNTRWRVATDCEFDRIIDESILELLEEGKIDCIDGKLQRRVVMPYD